MDKKQGTTFATIIILLLTSCGPGQIFGPTLTPLPTNTNTPTITLTATLQPTHTETVLPIHPKAGNWIGNSSINVNGNNYNFDFEFMVSEDSTNIIVKRLHIAGTWISGMVPGGEPIKNNGFNWKVDTRSIGTATITILFITEGTYQGKMILGDGTSKWTGEWNSPSEE